MITNLQFLNILPYGLYTHMTIVISAIFSLFFCLLAFLEIIHIIYNKFYPDYDWGSKKAIKDSEKTVQQRHESKQKQREQNPKHLIICIIIYFICILLLVLIFPYFHI